MRSASAGDGGGVGGGVRDRVLPAAGAGRFEDDAAWISLAGFFVFQLGFAAGVERRRRGTRRLIICLLPLSGAITTACGGSMADVPADGGGDAASLAGMVLIVLARAGR
jgi:hypothetical protein